MSDTQQPPSDKDAELEREIRAERKFSLSEAIGRMAGPGMMKGVSPVTPKRQAEAAIEDCVRRNLIDAGGVLGVVLLRRVEQSELLLNDYDQPLAVLASYVRRVLGSDYLLQDLVREADVEWGRAYGEHPHFERPGCPPHPDDPYTTESVRNALTRLVEKLAAGGA
ncbi:MAG TPA: hypothetical protein VM529_21680 [Gemmata sp.]|nr:hypothetical protein [Gemmata sp.]